MKEDNEFKEQSKIEEAMENLSNAVQYAKTMRSANRLNTANGGVTKLYNRRGSYPTLETFYMDKKSQDDFRFIIDAVEKSLNIKLSKSVFLKRMIENYTDHFLKLMETGVMTKDLNRFIKTLEAERQTFIKVTGRGTKRKRTGEDF